QTSTESDPVHTYTEAGVYSVTLIADGPAGPDTLVKPDFIEVTGGGVGTDGASPDLPSGFHLAQNYPNPFNPVTHIEYRLDRSQYVELSIYDLNGHLVRCLDKGYRTAGTHVRLWDGRDERGIRMQSGIYLCRLESGTGQRLVKKAILMK
ncbi:MAG: T9SS type A sorting domain-containing protein, partial [Fidelibacterota bacterium]